MTNIDDLGPELATRTSPFPRLRPAFSKLIPFDLENDSTYCNFAEKSSLYAMISEYVCELHGVQKSCTLSPIANTSPATKLLEKFAKTAFVANSKKKSSDSESKNDDADVDEAKDNTKKLVKLGLGLGVHRFEYEKEDLYLLHQTIGEPAASNCGSPQFHSSLVLFVHGQNRASLLKQFCSQVIEWNESKTDSMFFSIYKYHIRYRYWNRSVKKISRHPSTIILPEKTWNLILDDVTRFLDEKTVRWYFEHGIPYKRNYLFYGEPGSGKSSLIQALAGKFNRNLCFLQPTHPEMTDDAFKTCIQKAPANSLIVLEDIDALFRKDRSKKHQSCPLTFSGLLNGLDGVGNPDGQIFILTTNFVEKLDQALIRSGRVDLHIEFPLATDEQLRNMLLLFYPGSSQIIQDRFVQEMRSNFAKGISMAAVQQLFIQNMFRPVEVLLSEVKNLGDRLDVVRELNDQTKLPEKEESEPEPEEITKLTKKLPKEWKNNKACAKLIEIATKNVKQAQKEKTKQQELGRDDAKDDTKTGDVEIEVKVNGDCNSNPAASSGSSTSAKKEQKVTSETVADSDVKVNEEIDDTKATKTVKTKIKASDQLDNLIKSFANNQKC